MTSAASKAPIFVTVGLLAALIVTLLVFLGLYVYFAIFKENLLRSEHHDIQRMAMEAVIGDDEKGFRRMVFASVIGGEITKEQASSLGVTPKGGEEPTSPRKIAPKVSRARRPQSPDAGESSPS